MQLEIAPPKRSDQLVALARLIASVAVIGLCMLVFSQTRGIGSYLRSFVSGTVTAKITNPAKPSFTVAKQSEEGSIIGRIGPTSKQARRETSAPPRSGLNAELSGVQASWKKASPNLSRSVVSGLKRGERFAQGTEQAIRNLPETINEATGIEQWGREAAWKVKQYKSSASSSLSSGTQSFGKQARSAKR